MYDVSLEVHKFVLELLRRGYSVSQVATALAEQKVKLMQADEYLAAQNESSFRP
jgi:hypothetical protein